MKIVIDIDTGLTGTDHALRALRAMSDTIAGPAEVILDSGQHTFVVTEIAGIMEERTEENLGTFTVIKTLDEA